MDYSDEQLEKDTLLLERYRVDKFLASGGMGKVYLATDIRLGRLVVCKFPHKDLLFREGFKERFQKEVSTLVKLQYPGVLAVLDFGEHENQPFVVLQYLSKGSLEDKLGGDIGDRKNLQSIKDVITWATPIAKTLDQLHKEGVIHRDVKPGNILFDEHDNPYISDFGIVKVLKGLEEDEAATGTSGSIGSVGYMAPEYIQSEYGPEYDQYLLATVLYECLSGALPFKWLNQDEYRVIVATQDPLSLIEKAPHLSEAVTAPIMKALSRNPDERFSSCQTFIEALNADSASSATQVSDNTAQKTSSKKTATPPPLKTQSVTPESYQTAISAEKKSKTPLIVTGLLSIIALAVGGFFLLQHNADKKIETATITAIDPPKLNDPAKAVSIDPIKDVKTPVTATTLEPIHVVKPEPTAPTPKQPSAQEIQAQLEKEQAELERKQREEERLRAERERAKAEQAKKVCTKGDAIHKQAARGNVSFVKKCLNLKVNINIKDKKLWTPLHAASNQGRLQVVKLLVSKGAQISLKEINGFTPLDLAIRKKQQSTIKFLKQKGALATLKIPTVNPNTNPAALAKTRQQCLADDAFHKAAARGNLSFVKKCIKAKININQREKNGWTALHSASSSGRLNIVKELIKNGANINASANAGHRPLDLAQSANHQSVVTFLKKRGAVGR
ncbi:MAG: hypothetical protein DSZ29_06490 [Aquificaceae bacterium]|nr:MAG: hypothetical protein DSZ29_06490 [Aquificaceae bacterium]